MFISIKSPFNRLFTSLKPLIKSGGVKSLTSEKPNNLLEFIDIIKLISTPAGAGKNRLLFVNIAFIFSFVELVRM